jgi:YVTN family beta-propeller protein
MQDLPRGTVTFLFTDIEGSTRLLRENRPSYGEILARHARILRTVFETHGGWEVDTQGDSFFAAFRTARDAVEAAAAAHQALVAHPWPGGAEPKVRMGMHTGEPVISGDRYVGLAVHRAARICAAAHGGQVLLSSTTCSLLADELVADSGLSDLGEHRLKDFDQPERIFQLVVDGLPSAFPPPRTEQPTDLPAAMDGSRISRAPWRRALREQRLWLLLALGLLVIVPLLAVIAARSGGSASEVPARSVAVIDAGTDEVTGSVPLASSAGPIVASGGAVWTASPDDRTLVQIDPQTLEVIGRTGVGIAARSLASGEGMLWVAGGASGTIVQFLPGTDDVNAPRALSVPADGYPVISALGHGLWLGENDSGGVAHFSGASRVEKLGSRSLTPEAIAAAAGAVWVVDRYDQEVARVDPATGTVLDQIPVGMPIPAVGTSTIHAPVSNALLDESGLWVTDELEGKVWHIRPAEGSIRGVISTGPGASSLAAGNGSIWVANRADGTVSRIDPQEDRVTATIKVADHVSGIAVADGKVWVGVP